MQRTCFTFRNKHVASTTLEIGLPGTAGVLRFLLRIATVSWMSLCLIGCATTQAAITQHLPPGQAPPIHSPPKQAPPVQARNIPYTHWSIDAVGCSEDISLSSDDFSLVISNPTTLAAKLVVNVGRSHQWLRPSLHAVRLKFSGSRGSWGAEGRSVKTGAVFRMTPDDTFLVKVMALLNGGTVEVLAKASKLLTVAVPPAGDRGQGWFECMRARIL